MYKVCLFLMSSKNTLTSLVGIFANKNLEKDFQIYTRGSRVVRSLISIILHIAIISPLFAAKLKTSSSFNLSNPFNILVCLPLVPVQFLHSSLKLQSPWCSSWRPNQTSTKYSGTIYLPAYILCYC